MLRAAGPAGVAQAPLVLPRTACPVGSWTGQDPRIGAARLAMTDRAGRWATAQVGRHGRTVNEVAGELGCDWHTVNDAVHRLRHPAGRRPGPDRAGDRGRARRGALRPAGPVAHPGVVDLDRRCRHRAAARCDPWPLRRGGVQVVHRPTVRVVRADRLGGAPVRPVAAHLRHRAALGHPGGGPVPPGQAGQPAPRRGAPPGAERDPRSPGPQERSAVPVPPATHQGRRTPRRPGPQPAAWPARRRRPPGRGPQTGAGTPRKSCAPSTTTTTPTSRSSS